MNFNNVIKIEKFRYEKKFDNYSTILHKLILTTRHHITAHLNYREKIESKQNREKVSNKGQRLRLLCMKI